MTNWIWWALGIGAVGISGYIISSSGKKTPAKTACIADLAEPYKSQAMAAVKAGDVAKINAFAAQASAAGWACAANEMRAAAAKITGAVEAEAASRAKMSLAEVAASTATDSTIKGNTSAALALFMKPKLGGAGEAIDYKRIQFVVKPTSTEIRMLDDLSAALNVAKYYFASAQATDAAGAARTASIAPIYTAAPVTEFVATYTPSVVSDPLGTLPADVRAEVDAAYASGDPQRLDDVAADRLVPYPAAWKKVKADAAAIHERWLMELGELPGATGSRSALAIDEMMSTTGASWLSSPSYLWAEQAPQVPASGLTYDFATLKNILDEFWKRGFRTAANQLGHEAYKKTHSGTDSSYFNTAYPLPT